MSFGTTAHLKLKKKTTKKKKKKKKKKKEKKKKKKKKTKKQLDAIHVEATRIMTGATKLCSIERLFFFILDGSLFDVVEINTSL